MRALFAILTFVLGAFTAFVGGHPQAQALSPCVTLDRVCALAIQKQVNAKVGAQDRCQVARAEDVSGVQCTDGRYVLRIVTTRKAWHVVSVQRVGTDHVVRGRLQVTLGGTFAGGDGKE